MRAAGILLVLAGAVCAFVLRRREAMRPIRVGRAVLGDLSVLSYQICVLQRPLPELLAETLAAGPAGPFLWRPLLAHIREAEERGTSLPACWRQAAEALPPPLGRILTPLGELIPAGGGRLAAAIEETREELTGFLRAETARQAEQGRITAALCLSGACLLILVLL